ncbi:hypothetical protein BAUCODRAFT_258020 [Baudoinia panamericana UAMH 10762]|uniref:FAD-binding domain-containing protein n=1 Tax=Baudoinia panamericana (strain UAMH 10762) TaxID=717646 RepID=M2N176_BAUPA|nr:uncharacterized protein BAUCODRAFT_258020 [Baudoinia panamericana UAMH 10762]EMC92684.1 hypothetical protein BAUCODRAFT_258020 [Baudoinia panamericana UAMH 10762]
MTPPTTTTTTPQPPIAIVGAGPSGLILARLLENAGIAYTVFDRDASASSSGGQGGTLDIHVADGQQALKEAGLISQFRARARGDSPTIMMDKTGKVFLDSAMFASQEVEGEKAHADRPEIDRRDLRDLLLGSIPEGRVRWGVRVQEVFRGQDGLMGIRFVDGRVEAGFRLVVGADGAWSKVRRLVTSAKPQYSGFHFLTTIIKPSNPYHSAAASVAGKGMNMMCAHEKQVVMVKLGDESYYVGVAMALPESWRQENADLLANPSQLGAALVRDYLADWPQAQKDVVGHADEQFRPWPLYAMPTESLSWETVPGVALVGDAAHLTTPFVGEGVNCAMYDSLQLAQQIVKHGVDDLTAAVAAYEKEMFPRGIDLIQRSAKSGELLFAPDAPRGWLKHHVGIEVD